MLLSFFFLFAHLTKQIPPNYKEWVFMAKTILEQLGVTYSQAGDYHIPNIALL